jgi:hypothetical protein
MPETIWRKSVRLRLGRLLCLSSSQFPPPDSENSCCLITSAELEITETKHRTPNAQRNVGRSGNLQILEIQNNLRDARIRC